MAASGAIPAALMARVPVLVDPKELQAYAYLEPPAYLLRFQDEDEFQALTRLQEAGKMERLTSRDKATAWEAFETRMYRKNSEVLSHALGITPRPKVNPTLRESVTLASAGE